jgi:hypothetical protein
MIRVRLEIWMQLENLGADFHSTGVCATREEEVETCLIVSLRNTNRFEKTSFREVRVFLILTSSLP